jgi:hypothetical protein
VLSAWPSSVCPGWLVPGMAAGGAAFTAGVDIAEVLAVSGGSSGGSGSFRQDRWVRSTWSTASVRVRARLEHVLDAQSDEVEERNAKIKTAPRACSTGDGDTR